MVAMSSSQSFSSPLSFFAGTTDRRKGVTMSNKSIVAADNSTGVPAVMESLERLEYLTKAQHRGRGDTWEAARDRAARFAEIETTYAARLWHRARDMKDVAGSVYRNLMIAYEAQVAANNRIAEHHRQVRLAVRGNDETSNFSALAPERVGAPALNATAP